MKTKSLRFIITAGPTREHIDPVRFLSNPSTGKMGFAIARAAAACGHDVTLVAGPVTLKTPKDVRRIDVTSAREMLAAVEGTLKRRPAGRHFDVVVATAAVADWRPAKCATKKLKKSEMSGVLKLVRNPDILKTLSSRVKARAANNAPRTTFFLGFAAETNDVISEARRKCREKNLEMIVANDVTEKGSGFGTDTNRVTFVKKDGTIERLPLMTKLAVAKRIVRAVEKIVNDESRGSR